MESPKEVHSLDKLLSRLTVGEKTILDIETDKKDGSKKVEFSIQRLPAPAPEPLNRAESPARAHDFYEHAGFADYLARYGAKGDIVVYADPSSETMWATLMESAQNGVETLELKPQLHALWKPWSDIADKKLPLDFWRDHLNRYRRSVRSPDGRTLALQMAQIRGAVEVTIHDGRGRDALNGIIVRSNVQGQETREPIDLPEEIVLHLPLYVGGEPQDVNLDLVVDADAHGTVTVLISASGVKEARVLAFENMLAAIRERLKEHNAVVCYGRPKTRDWDYLGDES